MAVPALKAKIGKGEYMEAKAHGDAVEVWATEDKTRKVTRRVVIACAGHEFTKAYSRVPEGCEAEAEQNPFLNVRIAGKAKVEKKAEKKP